MKRNELSDLVGLTRINFDNCVRRGFFDGLVTPASRGVYTITDAINVYAALQLVSVGMTYSAAFDCVRKARANPTDNIVADAHGVTVTIDFDAVDRALRARAFGMIEAHDIAA